MTSTEPRALLPFLQPVYDVVTPLAWPIVRVAVGWNMIVHGYAKILRGFDKQAELLAHDGLNFGVWFAQFLCVVELGGGIFISLGLFTRFWAAQISLRNLRKLDCGAPSSSATSPSFSIGTTVLPGPAAATSTP